VEQFERTSNLIVRSLPGALVRFCGEKKRLAMASNPIPQQLLGFAIAGRHVDVIDSVLQDKVHCDIDIFWRRIPKSCRAKDSSGAFVTSSTE
jgi:hypothetical protein